MEVNFCIILHLLESAYLLTKWSNFASLERKLRSGIYSHVVLQFFVIEVGLESRAEGRPKNPGPSILIQGERPLMTSDDFRRFLTYLPFSTLKRPIFGSFLPTLKSDVINGRSLLM